MDPYATSHFSNRELLHDFDTRVAHNHTSLAVLLTRIAEIDERRLYLPEGYPSMKAFLVQRMRLPTENAAYKRLTAARLVRKYPGVLVALAAGRLHLTAVLMLGHHLTSANADELVAAALDKTCFELEVVLAGRFPRPDLPERLSAIAMPVASLPPAGPMAEVSLAARRVEATIPEQNAHGQAGACAAQLSPERFEAPRARVVPLAPQKFGFQFTGDLETHDLYEKLRALMCREIPTGEMALVFKGALRVAVAHYMKRKFAATGSPGGSRDNANPRHIPAAVKRAVRDRDGDRCTYVTEAGQRCTARRLLETIWNDGLAVVESSHLREERPTRWHEATLDRGLAPAAPEPHTKGARRGHAGYHLRRDGRSQEGDQRGDAVARATGAGGVAGGQ